MTQTMSMQRALERAPETGDFLLGAGCRFKIPAVFQRCFPGKVAIIIADDKTFAAAGRTVQAALQASEVASVEPFVFPGEPTLHADYEHVERLREVLSASPDLIPLAVGSGTINDLVKRTVFELERRYLVLATAASVDGYSSFGAPIVQQGFKKTMDCPAPLVIVADSEVLRDAPPEMSAAGYADLMSKIPAGADWILADLLDLDPIEPVAWDMVQAGLRRWVGAPEQLQQGDAQAFEALFEGLTMSGFAMQAIRKSRPASGADHLLSHIWDMQYHRDAQGHSVSHGFQVALGSLASIALMERFFAKDIPKLDIDAVCRKRQSWDARAADILKAFGENAISQRAIEESRAKFADHEELRARLTRLVSKWDEMRARVQAQLFPYAEFRAMLAAAACPVTPQQIHLSRERFRETFRLAQMIRNRYTILDLAYETGLLEECVEEILASPCYLS